mmetsp:Transcript_12595/g.36222  ORF Transcript_12595/g.36222 Transcript_12595/m.36222 type:complete len:231 (+) Transcript_12595:104-796(+)
MLCAELAMLLRAKDPWANELPRIFAFMSSTREPASPSKAASKDLVSPDSRSSAARTVSRNSTTISVMSGATGVGGWPDNAKAWKGARVLRCNKLPSPARMRLTAPTASERLSEKATASCSEALAACVAPEVLLGKPSNMAVTPWESVRSAVTSSWASWKRMPVRRASSSEAPRSGADSFILCKRTAPTPRVTLRASCFTWARKLSVVAFSLLKLPWAAMPTANTASSRRL